MFLQNTASNFRQKSNKRNWMTERISYSLKRSMMINENCNRALWLQTRRPQNFPRLFFEKSTKGIRERSFYTHVLASQGLSSPTFVISEVLGNEFLKYFLKFFSRKMAENIENDNLTMAAICLFTF